MRRLELLTDTSQAKKTYFMTKYLMPDMTVREYMSTVIILVHEFAAQRDTSNHKISL